jgi:hypothetical protein
MLWTTTPTAHLGLTPVYYYLLKPIVNPRLSPTYFHDLLAIFWDPLSWVLVSFYVILTSVLHAFILAPSSNASANFSELVVFIK